MASEAKMTIGISLPKKRGDEIAKRAAAIHISKSKYCQLALTDWLNNGGKLSIQEK